MKIQDFYKGQIVQTITPLQVEVADGKAQTVSIGTIYKVTFVSLRHESKMIPGGGPNGKHIFAGYLKLIPSLVNPFDKKKLLPLIFIEEEEGMDFPFSIVKKA